MKEQFLHSLSLSLSSAKSITMNCTFNLNFRLRTDKNYEDECDTKLNTFVLFTIFGKINHFSCFNGYSLSVVLPKCENKKEIGVPHPYGEIQ